MERCLCNSFIPLHVSWLFWIKFAQSLILCWFKMWRLCKHIFFVSLLVLLISFGIGKFYFRSKVLGRSPIVSIENGKIQGQTRTSRGGRVFHEYKGIPFATPPLGELRYVDPQPLKEKWDGVKDTTEFGNICLQIEPFMMDVDGGEDCLFINIYTNHKKGEGLYPVMVYIYGGIFTFGASNIYPPDYFMDESIVLVTLNYRLNSFGFLNTGDGIIHGNMGLKDQQLALKWVQANIEKFNGDKNRVTIFGESAGGSSVHYHILSPQSRGLFHSAIAQSGLATSPWAIQLHPREQFLHFAKKVGCLATDQSETKNTRTIISCLRSKDAKELIKFHEGIYDNLCSKLETFLPTIEMHVGEENQSNSNLEKFLTKSPQEIIKDGNYAKVPFIAGVMDTEGLIVAASLQTNATFASLLSTRWDEMLPKLLPNLKNLLPHLTSSQFEKIRSFYNLSTISYPPSRAQIGGLSHLVSDWWWFQGLRTIPPSQDTYLYWITHQGHFSFAEAFLNLRRDYHPVLEMGWMVLKKWWSGKCDHERFGACHGDDIHMLWETDPFSNIGEGHPDLEFSKKLIKLWVDFATTNGKKDLEFNGLKWPKGGKLYLQLDKKANVIEEPFKERMEFWERLGLKYL